MKHKVHCAATLKHSNWKEFFVCFLVAHDACCLTCVLAFIYPFNGAVCETVMAYLFLMAE